MIASVRGRVERVGLDHGVIDVHGVGLLVRLTPATASRLRPGDEAHLSTCLIIRESAWSLYGFTDDGERETFEVTQSVSGVGPALGLAMLSVLSPARLRAAITNGEVATLVKVPGVGKKTAERIILELKEKMAALALQYGDGGEPAQQEHAPCDAGPAWRAPVVEALISLGWSTRQAQAAADASAAHVPSGASVAAALKAALQDLGR